MTIKNRIRPIVLSILLSTPLISLGGTWQALTNQPQFISVGNPGGEAPGGATNPLLLTDGSVIVQNNGFWATGEIWKLTPDNFGSYVNGTWSQLASLPGGYIPTYYVSAVLPDGRVIFQGGEYNGTNYDWALTGQGALYNPINNTWTSVSGPSFFENLYPSNPPVPRYPSPLTSTLVNPLGDGAGVILPNGTLMLNDKLSKQAALLDINTMSWTETGTSTKATINAEEGWVLLPNRKVLVVDLNFDYWFGLIPAYPAGPENSELYDPKTGTWSSAGSTKSVLSSFPGGEMGPMVLRADGTVFAIGSTGNTAIYNSRTNRWQAGPILPKGPGTEGQLGVIDGSAALLPNGNVLFTAAPIEPEFSPPLHIFEFDGKKLIEQPTIPNASVDPTYVATMLVLPTGQILMTDFSNDVEIYTPSDNRYQPNWSPVINSYPRTISPGKTYKITGIRFNGMSQGAMYGDDYQMATNYPLIRVTNLKTGHVFYNRTHDHSSMGVDVKGPVFTSFDVPQNIELGESKLEVIANGIPSKAKTIEVKAN